MDRSGVITTVQLRQWRALEELILINLPIQRHHEQLVTITFSTAGDAGDAPREQSFDFMCQRDPELLKNIAGLIENVRQVEQNVCHRRLQESGRSQSNTRPCNESSLTGKKAWSVLATRPAEIDARAHKPRQSLWFPREKHMKNPISRFPRPRRPAGWPG